ALCRVHPSAFRPSSAHRSVSVRSLTWCSLLSDLSPKGYFYEYRVGIVDIGCMGHLGIQFAKAIGAAVVLALSRFANKEQEIPRLGAYELVVYTDEKQAADSANSVDILLITTDTNNMAYTLFPPSSTKVFCDEK
ncbi:hypothetical protein PF005_g33562, partial [Phytophthora fragariae]